MSRGLTQRGLAVAAIAAGALGISACGSSHKATQVGNAPTGHPGNGKSTSNDSVSTSASTSTTLPGKGKPAFVMGDKNFPEENILGDLYQQALQAQGYTVTLKPNIGDTEVTFKALAAGQIDGYPEYDGTLLASVANITANPASSAAAASATQAYATKHGYVFSTVTPFTDSDAIATLKTFATKHGLKSIGDLAKLGKGLTLAGAPEFGTRYPDGLLGMEKIYGVKPTFSPVSIGSFYSLLDSMKDEAAAVFTTDPQLKSGKYTVLSDPKAIFGYQNVGVIAKAALVKSEGPAFLATINKVSALLTQPAIIQLNAGVELDQQSAATVAKTFLQDNGLLH